MAVAIPRHPFPGRASRHLPAALPVVADATAVQQCACREQSSPSLFSGGRQPRLAAVHAAEGTCAPTTPEEPDGAAVEDTSSTREGRFEMSPARLPHNERMQQPRPENRCVCPRELSVTGTPQSERQRAKQRPPSATLPAQHACRESRLLNGAPPPVTPGM